VSHCGIDWQYELMEGVMWLITDFLPKPKVKASQFQVHIS